jgi:hypothetical protein
VNEENAGKDDPRISLIEILVAGRRDDPEELGEKNDPIDGIDAPESFPCKGGKRVGVADVVPVSGENDDTAEDEKVFYAEPASIEGEGTGQEGCVMNDHEHRRDGTTSLQRQELTSAADTWTLHKHRAAAHRRQPESSV